jgi:hypothetical protein
MRFVEGKKAYWARSDDARLCVRDHRIVAVQPGRHLHPLDPLPYHKAVSDDQRLMQCERRQRTSFLIF